MRTEEVLASIDHALGDWSVSGDAMRWTPARRIPIITPEQAARLFTEMGEAMTPVIRGFVEIVEQAARDLAGLRIHFREAGLLSDDPPSEDPRARALWLRRNRSTGPVVPTAARQKRPRRLA